jgi:hypothetical protein
MKGKKVELRVVHAHETGPVKIVADAAMSTAGQHGGRLLPVILIDTSDRPDIAELIRVHESLGPGDVKVQWGKPEGKDHRGTVALFLTFIRPMEVFMILEFNVIGRGFLVEQILNGNGIYLAEAQGAEDRLHKNPSRARVLAEVPDTGFRDTWDNIFFKHLTQHFQRKGLNRSRARQSASSTIAELRTIGSFKMRDS